MNPPAVSYIGRTGCGATSGWRQRRLARGWPALTERVVLGFPLLVLDVFVRLKLLEKSSAVGVPPLRPVCRLDFVCPTAERRCSERAPDARGRGG